MVKLALRVVAAVFLLLSFPHTAEAQMSWSGVYAGFDLGAGFKDLDFTVADSVQAPAFRMVTGHAGHGVLVGGHAGWDFLIAKRIIVGGEAGFGELRYDGAVHYSLGNDTLGETTSGFSWTAMARAGYVYKQVMPYFAAGVMGSKNTAHVLDDCNTHPVGIPWERVPARCQPHTGSWRPGRNSRRPNASPAGAGRCAWTGCSWSPRRS